MLTRDGRTKILGLLAAFLVASMLLAHDLRPKHEDFLRAAQPVKIDEITDPYSKGAGGATPFQSLLPVMLGFREVVASLLWVQADDLFHRGEYGPILHLVREIAAIDPHNLDVFATGAWHMAYNFMDKRLIRTGLEFLDDGVKHNPNIYDLYFESGWTNMDKMKDYPKAMYWYQIASTKGTSDGRPRPPAFTWHQLAIAHERAGDIDGAIRQWEKTGVRETKELAEKPKDFAARSNHDVSAHNLFETRDLRLPLRRHLGDQPLNAGLDFKVTRLAPRKLRIEGNINVLDLSRVNIVFRDKNWQPLDGRCPEDPIRPIDRCPALDPERVSDEERMQRLTLEWNDSSVRGGHFKWDLNLNKDPADMDRDPRTIYPLASDEYEVTVTFDARNQAPFIQDVYGWNGEGITDPKHLVIDNTRAGIVEGKRVPLRLIQKRITLKRAQVL